MHPRTVELLGDLVGMADRFLRARRPSGREADRAVTRRLLRQAQELCSKPSEDGEHLVDDVSVWLAQALDNAEREGPLGKTGKWHTAAQALIPLVRMDLSRALEKSRHISTTEQEWP